MFEVIDRHKVHEEFDCLEGACADCGELVLFSKDTYGLPHWLHKVQRANGYFGFEYFCPEKEGKK